MTPPRTNRGLINTNKGSEQLIPAPRGPQHFLTMWNRVPEVSAQKVLFCWVLEERQNVGLRGRRRVSVGPKTGQSSRIFDTTVFFSALDCLRLLPRKKGKRGKKRKRFGDGKTWPPSPDWSDEKYQSRALRKQHQNSLKNEWRDFVRNSVLNDQIMIIFWYFARDQIVTSPLVTNHLWQSDWLRS